MLVGLVCWLVWFVGLGCIWVDTKGIRNRKKRSHRLNNTATKKPNQKRTAPKSIFFRLGVTSGSLPGQCWTNLGVGRLTGEIRFICVFVSLFCDQFLHLLLRKCKRRKTCKAIKTLHMATNLRVRPVKHKPRQL